MKIFKGGVTSGTESARVGKGGNVDTSTEVAIEAVKRGSPGSRGHLGLVIGVHES
jgi:hypothetical protein